MNAIQTLPTDSDLASSIAKTIAFDGEGIRLQITDMLNNMPQFLANEVEPFESDCTDEKLAEYLLTFSNQVCTHIAQLELQLEIQKGKDKIIKLANSVLSELGLTDVEFTITADENDDDDDEYLSERVKDLMNMPIDEWAYFGGYVLELKEEVSRACFSI